MCLELDGWCCTSWKTYFAMRGRSIEALAHEPIEFDSMENPAERQRQRQPEPEPEPEPDPEPEPELKAT